MDKTKDPKDRGYTHCIVDCFENGRFLARVKWDEQLRAWKPFMVEVDGEWMDIMDFEEIPEYSSYGCENYHHIKPSK